MTDDPALRDGAGATPPATKSIRVAASGDIHCSRSRESQILESLAKVSSEADLLLLAGDLTTQGEPEEAEALAEVCAVLGVPVVGVLGNHDWHAGRADEVSRVLSDAGVTMLDRSSCIHESAIGEIGIVGAKGFIGGFAGSHLPDFGEPPLREVYAETSRHVDAIDRGLRDVANCPVRIVLMHYSPCLETLEGEREGIITFLGCDRMAAPILEHSPNLVLHGHAHNGRLRGTIGEVPVFNVSAPVMRRGFWTFEFSGAEAVAPIH